jgi:CRP/FNR family transcriptional regulator, cyclic AMP receptor protein
LADPSIDHISVDAVATVIRGSRLFAELSREYAVALARVVERVGAPERAAIVREGDVGDDLFLIERGRAEVCVDEGAREPRVVSTLYAGDYFGEIGLLGAGRRSATVIAVTPLRLLKLTRAAYLGSLSGVTSVTRQLDASARKRANPAASNQAVLPQPVFDAVLDRLIEHEVESMRAAEIRGDRPTFDEIIDFYGRTRFLYPEKLGLLQSRFDAVRETWRRLIAANGDVFRILMLRRPVEDRLVAMNSICAFEYASGTWLGQHLVSGQQHEYTGTLAALIGLVGGLHIDGAEFIRLTFRPNNPGVRLLFGGVAEALPSETAHLVVRKHAIVPLPPRVDQRGLSGQIRVERVARGDDRALDLYRALMHPVDADSLRLADPRLAELESSYAAHGLSRSREIVVATVDGTVVGAVLCNVASEGMNFSFLENAVEDLVVAPDLSAEVRSAVITELMGEVCAVYRSLGRSYLVLLLDEVLADVLQLLGAAETPTKEYGILTVSRDRDSFLIANRFFTGHYRSLVLQAAMADAP